MWDTLLSKVEEELNHADLKETVQKLLADGFEKEMRLVNITETITIWNYVTCLNWLLFLFSVFDSNE